MEKHETAESSGDKYLKSDVEYSARDFDLGQIVNVESTPEEQRKVLRKLDLL